MRFKNLIIPLSITLFVSCAGNNQEVLKKTDEIFGCDNPHRQLTDMEYKICVDKQRAAGGEPMDLDKLGTNLKDYFTPEGGVVYQASINKSLWDGAIKVTNQYPLKIADNQGGYIETDWIYSEENTSQRCAIKIQILSRELLSNGLETTFICQNKIDDIWVGDGTKYFDQEKRMTLKILEEAKRINSSS